MSENMRHASRLAYSANVNPTHEDIRTGCMQRIADATELMAKRHQDLLNERDQARTSRDYWQREYDHMARRLVSAKGQITKLKRKAAGTVA